MCEKQIVQDKDVFWVFMYLEKNHMTELRQRNCFEIEWAML